MFSQVSQLGFATFQKSLSNIQQVITSNNDEFSPRGPDSNGTSESGEDVSDDPDSNSYWKQKFDDLLVKSRSKIRMIVEELRKQHERNNELEESICKLNSRHADFKKHVVKEKEKLRQGMNKEFEIICKSCFTYQSRIEAYNKRLNRVQASYDQFRKKISTQCFVLVKAENERLKKELQQKTSELNDLLQQWKAAECTPEQPPLSAKHCTEDLSPEEGTAEMKESEPATHHCSNASCKEKIQELKEEAELWHGKYVQLNAFHIQQTLPMDDTSEAVVKSLQAETTKLRERLVELKTNMERDKKLHLLALTKQKAEHIQAYNLMKNELENEQNVSLKLREQIKSIQKALRKKSMSYNKLKKKHQKILLDLDLSQHEVTRLNEKRIALEDEVKELLANHEKAKEAILVKNDLTYQLKGHLETNSTLKQQNEELKAQVLVLQDMMTKVRNENRMFGYKVSRLTKFHKAVSENIYECQDLLTDSCRFLPIHILNDQEIAEDGNLSSDDESSDAHFEDEEKQFVASDSEEFQVPNSELNAAEIEILRTEWETDQVLIRNAGRIRIQVSLLSDQLKQCKEEKQSLKCKIHKVEETNVRLINKLRQVYEQRQLGSRIRRGIKNREKSSLSFATLRGITSINGKLTNLLKTDDKVSRMVHEIDEEAQAIQAGQRIRGAPLSSYTSLARQSYRRSMTNRGSGILPTLRGLEYYR